MFERNLHILLPRSDALYHAAPLPGLFALKKILRKGNKNSELYHALHTIVWMTQRHGTSWPQVEGFRRRAEKQEINRSKPFCCRIRKQKKSILELRKLAEQRLSHQSGPSLYRFGDPHRDFMAESNFNHQVLVLLKYSHFSVCYTILSFNNYWLPFLFFLPSVSYHEYQSSRA